MFRPWSYTEAMLDLCKQIVILKNSLKKNGFKTFFTNIFFTVLRCGEESITSILCSLSRDKGVQLEITLNMARRESFAFYHCSLIKFYIVRVCIIPGVASRESKSSFIPKARMIDWLRPIRALYSCSNLSSLIFFPIHQDQFVAKPSLEDAKHWT